MAMKNKTYTAEGVTAHFELNESAGYYKRLEEIANGDQVLDSLLMKAIEPMLEEAISRADPTHGYNGEYERTGAMADAVEARVVHDGNEIDAEIYISETLRTVDTDGNGNVVGATDFNYGVFEEMGRPGENGEIDERHKFLEPAFHVHEKNVRRVLGALLGHYVTKK